MFCGHSFKVKSELFILPKGNWGGRRVGRINNREKAFYRNQIKRDLSALNSIITKPRDAICQVYMCEVITPRACAS